MKAEYPSVAFKYFSQKDKLSLTRQVACGILVVNFRAIPLRMGIAGLIIAPPIHSWMIWGSNRCHILRLPRQRRAKWHEIIDD